jgi:hypothetical protein
MQRRWNAAAAVYGSHKQAGTANSSCMDAPLSPGIPDLEHKRSLFEMTKTALQRCCSLILRTAFHFELVGTAPLHDRQK